jgi:hypothetical protein
VQRLRVPFEAADIRPDDRGFATSHVGATLQATGGHALMSVKKCQYVAICGLTRSIPRVGNAQPPFVPQDADVF